MNETTTTNNSERVSINYVFVLTSAAALTLLLKTFATELEVAGVFFSCFLISCFALYEYLTFKGKTQFLNSIDIFLLYAAPTILFFVLINAYSNHLEDSIEAIGNLLEGLIFVLVACLSVFIFVGIPILLLLSPFFITAYSWQSLQSSRIRTVLHEKGFTWISLKEAKVFHKQAGIKLANQLPPYDHLGTIPGYSSEDITTMVNIAKHLPRRFQSS